MEKLRKLIKSDAFHPCLLGVILFCGFITPPVIPFMGLNLMMLASSWARNDEKKFSLKPLLAKMVLLFPITWGLCGLLLLIWGISSKKPELSLLGTTQILVSIYFIKTNFTVSNREEMIKDTQ